MNRIRTPRCRRVLGRAGASSRASTMASVITIPTVDIVKNVSTSESYFMSTLRRVGPDNVTEIA
jgi:hypothetical protein